VLCKYPRLLFNRNLKNSFSILQVPQVSCDGGGRAGDAKAIISPSGLVAIHIHGHACLIDVNQEVQLFSLFFCRLQLFFQQTGLVKYYKWPLRIVNSARWNVCIWSNCYRANYCVLYVTIKPVNCGLVSVFCMHLVRTYDQLSRPETHFHPIKWSHAIPSSLASRWTIF